MFLDTLYQRSLDGEVGFAGGIGDTGSIVVFDTNKNSHNEHISDRGVHLIRPYLDRDVLSKGSCMVYRVDKFPMKQFTYLLTSLLQYNPR